MRLCATGRASREHQATATELSAGYCMTPLFFSQIILLQLHRENSVCCARYNCKKFERKKSYKKIQTVLIYHCSCSIIVDMCSNSVI